MLSYVHRFHAGCFADVHKHLILIALLNHLSKKATNYSVLDLFAGEGLYDLRSIESRKTGEYKQGIERLFSLKKPSALVKTLFEIINALNPPSEKNIYPGSPSIIAHFLREQDRAICIERHPQAFASLKKHFGHLKKMHLHERDAFEALHALLPLPEKRGLIFIDPSYEVKKEYQDIANKVIESYARFTQGIYAIWYPLLAENHHHSLVQKIQASGYPKYGIVNGCPMGKNQI